VSRRRGLRTKVERLARTARRGVRAHPERLAAALLVAAVGVLVYALAIELFPYHSVNDDEGVYLYQAAMLLDGKLFLRPGAIPWDAVRPWFFVVDFTDDGVRMYSKYSPVAPAMFAVGRLLGDWNLALGGIAAGTAAGVYALGTAAFDRRVGLVAVVALAGAPLFLMTSATFFSYAPATLLNVTFAVAYVRAARTGSPRWGAAAGVAIGLAFFCRPYTALLFAIPFIGHTLVSLAVAWRRHAWSPRFRGVLARSVAVAVPGAAFVGVTLGYNAVVTGDPLTFPYAAFAPNDGIGFGPHEILNYERDYTPELAAETTVTAIEYVFTDWIAAGAIGTVLAAVGVGAAGLRAWRRDGVRDRFTPTTRMADGEVAAVLLAVVPAVFLGEAYFWGTHNGLRNGLIDLLGPFYHFDVLVPIAVFSAAGAVGLTRGLATALRRHTTRRRARIVVLVVLAISAPFVAAAERDAIEDPYDANALRTDNLGATYEPFADRSFEDAVVFTPDPYGDWQAHPFQYLRSGGGFDGDAVYATDGGPERDLAVLAATNRTPYRFTYRGTWTGAARPVTPELERLRVLDGRTVRARTTVGVPQSAASVSVRVETPEGFARYTVPAEARENGTVTVAWRIGPEAAAATNLAFDGGSDGRAVPLADDGAEVDLAVTFVGSGGASLTYRQEATVANGADGVAVVWPPETRVCRLTAECGYEGTWVGPDGDYVGGVSVETDARVVDGEASEERLPPIRRTAAR
jgi:hypothetical protein